jgi:hypothetical protein
MVFDPAKRKRSSDGGDLPPAKRTASQTLHLDQPVQEELRRDVRQIYIHYDAITKAADGSEAAITAFQAILDAATGQLAPRTPEACGNGFPGSCTRCDRAQDPAPASACAHASSPGWSPASRESWTPPWTC